MCANGDPISLILLNGPRLTRYDRAYESGVRKIFSLARYPFTPKPRKKIKQIYAADILFLRFAH
jgi:hypothetical protein